MKPKPPQCGKIYLATNLLPQDLCLLVIGIDESSNALVFEEVNSSKLEEFKAVLGLYSSHYGSNILMYRDDMLQNELKGFQIQPVQSCSKTDTLVIVVSSFLEKKKIQIESSLSLKRKLAEFKGQNITSQVLALFCAVEELQGKLTDSHEPRKPLVSVIPRPPLNPLNPYPRNRYTRY